MQLQYNIAQDEKYVPGFGFAIDCSCLGYRKVAYLCTKSITKQGNRLNSDAGYTFQLSGLRRRLPGV